MALEGGGNTNDDRISRRRFLGLPGRNTAEHIAAAAAETTATPEPVVVERPVIRVREVPAPRLLDPLIDAIPGAAKVTKDATKEIVAVTAKGVGKVGLYATALAFVGYIWGVKWLTDKSVEKLGKGVEYFWNKLTGLASGGKKDHHDDHHHAHGH